MKIRRREFLVLSAAAALAEACGRPGVALPTPTASAARDELDAISDLIIPGGPPPDGIPPVEEPKYVSVTEASKQWKDDDVVDAFTIDGRPRAYPRLITVWHEIVNESAGGRPISITYCPLTGSTLVFAGELPDGTATTFGTSGQLYNSNLVMYDRASRAMWPQLLGVAVRGERKGERLREIPGAVTTTFGRWKRRYPDGLVLSTDTGHLRAYGTWPYGSYEADSGVTFPVRHEDARFHAKEIVVGVRSNGAALAIPKAELSRLRVANADVGGTPIVALFDQDLAAVRVFARATSKGPVRLALRDGVVLDDETRSRWDAEGRAEDGELAGTRLEQLSAYGVMWFAWFAFNPDTAVLA